MEELIRRLTNRGWKVAAISTMDMIFEADRREPIAGVIIMPEFMGLSYFRTGNTSSSGKKGYFPGEAHGAFSGSG